MISLLVSTVAHKMETKFFLGPITIACFLLSPRSGISPERAV